MDKKEHSHLTHGHLTSDLHIRHRGHPSEEVVKVPHKDTNMRGDKDYEETEFDKAKDDDVNNRGHCDPSDKTCKK
jgi:hypothetical protein